LPDEIKGDLQKINLPLDLNITKFSQR